MMDALPFLMTKNYVMRHNSDVMLENDWPFQSNSANVSSSNVSEKQQTDHKTCDSR